MGRNYRAGGLKNNPEGTKCDCQAAKSRPMSGTMKTARSLSVIMVFALLAVTARAGFLDEIKENLAGPEIEGTPKYTALYFSAHWCPPCRMFTPKLVEWYNDFKANHPDFELVFVSSDQDEAAMKEYIEGDKMPWPYVKFDKAKEEIFRKYSSDGIPYLVLIDENGKDLTGQPGNEWQSPDQVLSKIEELVP
jgi:thiol-disulfide isomerase/thioredoxin